MKARVHVYLKPGVLDPQGQAVSNSLNHLGFNEVAGVRQGKLIEIELSERVVVERLAGGLKVTHVGEPERHHRPEPRARQQDEHDREDHDGGGDRPGEEDRRIS